MTAVAEQVAVDLARQREVVAALGEDGRAEFARLVRSGLADYAEGDGVANPDEVNIVTGRR